MLNPTTMTTSVTEKRQQKLTSSAISKEMSNYNLYNINVIKPTIDNSINNKAINEALVKIKQQAGSCIILNLILTEEFNADPISQDSLNISYNTSNTIFIKVLPNRQNINILLTRAFFEGILLNTPNNFEDPDIISKIESPTKQTHPKSPTYSHISHISPIGSQRSSTQNKTPDTYTYTYSHPFGL